MTKNKRIEKTTGAEGSTEQPAPTATKESAAVVATDKTGLITSALGGLPGRARAFVKQHPGASLLAAAGAGALFVGEFAVGAVVGIGATLLITGSDPAKRQQLLDKSKGAFEAGSRWARDLVRRGQELARRTAQTQTPDQGGAKTPA
jgi:hypothetical protein